MFFISYLKFLKKKWLTNLIKNVIGQKKTTMPYDGWRKKEVHFIIKTFLSDQSFLSSDTIVNLARFYGSFKLNISVFAVSED